MVPFPDIPPPARLLFIYKSRHAATPVRQPLQSSISSSAFASLTLPAVTSKEGHLIDASTAIASYIYSHVLVTTSSQTVTMCDFTKNYYIYTSCVDPGVHFFRTSVDGSRKRSCPKGPHERYIMLPGQCPLCYG